VGAWYTVADGADRQTVAAAYRGALVAVRRRLGHLDIDLVSDKSWPDDVQWAVREGVRLVEERRSRRPWWPFRTSSDTVRADPRDDDQLAVVAALAPYTIGGTGLDLRGRTVWSVNDTGTSAVFRLTDDELAEVRAAVAAAGGDPRMLVCLERRGGRGLD
jgi:hypothetical protein